MTSRKKLVITVILGILLILLYMIIFRFSAQNGETSGNLSRSILSRVLECIHRISGGHLSEQGAEGISRDGEIILRKAAHFSEYAIMGILTMGILSCYLRKGKAYVFAVLWVLLSAIMDEWHQSFIPGRYARAFDVMIDTLGGMTGAFICIGIIWFIYRKKKNIS